MATASEKDNLPASSSNADPAEFRFGDVDWTETDWDCKPSQLAQEAANRIWDMPLCVIYERSPNAEVAMWCEWIQQAIYNQWLKDREAG